MLLKLEIAELLKKTITNLYSTVDPNSLRFTVEYSRTENFGDYSTNIPFILAGKLKENPFKIAETIKNNILDMDFISEVTVTKPAFLNFKLDKGWLQNKIFDIQTNNDNFGMSNIGNNRKYNIEFVSANPTGPLNVVSARAASIGNAIVNLLKTAGFSVHKEYYINDAGKQVLKLGKSVLLRYKELKGETLNFPDDLYRGEYVIDLAQNLLSTNASTIDSMDQPEQLKYFSEKAIEIMLKRQKEQLENFGISFDKWYSEKKELHDTDFVNQTLYMLQQKGLTYKKDDAIWLKTTELGDDKDRVLVRSDSTPTYFLADIAYHKNKFDRGFEYILDLWGPDHHSHIKRTELALKSIGLNTDNFKVLIIQQVNFIEDGKDIKMSKRAGNFITLEQLKQEIPTDVLKFFFIMRSCESHLDFDIDLAKSQSNENPVYYVQYAHARICSIIRNLSDNNITVNNPQNLNSLNNEHEIRLMKKIINFSEEIANSATELQPHRLTNYLKELAGLFHVFYTNCAIMQCNEPNLMNQRVVLIKVTGQVIKKGLNLLGISAPEKM